MDSDLTLQILELVVAVVFALISAHVVPLIKRFKENGKYDEVVEWTSEAVRAADQIMNTNEGKKEYVTSFIKTVLARTKLNLTDVQLDVLIESAVQQLKLEKQNQ